MVFYLLSWDQLQIQQLAFTTRQVNSVERTLQIFNVAVMCSQLSQLRLVHDAIDQYFDHVEELYYYDESVSFAGMLLHIQSYCMHM